MASTESPLYLAARDDDVEAVKALVASNADVRGPIPNNGFTALHVAAGHSSFKVAELLLGMRVDVNVTDIEKETPLHLAAQEGRADSVRWLTEHGADVKARNDDGETPLHVAVQHIGSKPVDHIVALLDARADARDVDSSGRTAAGAARLYSNRGDELSALLGSDDNVANELDTDKMLQNLCMRGHADGVSKCLQMFPSQIAPQRALIAAAMGGSVEVIELLVRARADPRAAEVDARTGMTPLIAAADEAKPKMVKWLLGQRVDATVVSRDGASALMAASLRGNDEAVHVLLEARSDINHQAHQGWNALMVASQSGHASAAKCLLDAKAQLDNRNSDGKSARDLADSNGHHDLVRILDTRAKLDARRAKAAQKPSEASHAQDSRDIDSLLASLGEPTHGKKSKPKAKKASKQDASPEDASTIAEPAETQLSTATNTRPTPPVHEAVAKGKAKKNRNTQAESKEHVPPGSASIERNTSSLPEPSETLAEAPTTPAGKRTGKKKTAATKLSREKAQALQVRLDEITSLRQALDAEEADIRRQLRDAAF
eukprot:TRINITY_DN47258_c0_g1_i1.p1 TRINITY_DN47258_c0_g1~~TRINITY_DN47258_c0_g1_i1.p1  ORF type:complete len:567 (+),score=78.29 TRINITY_DN47258_c0_g1_i1:66-1703(+)